MKDRWKLLIATIIIGSIVTVLFLFLGFSFKKVGLREFGLLEYAFYRTVDRSQTVRENGNYLVGIDHRFVTYPKSMLKHNFSITALTKDKSMVTMQGLFLAQLIESEIVDLHFSYGPDQYFKIVSKAVEEYFRESLQQFLLKQIISQRYSVNSFISSNVCLNIEAKYSFINCEYVSTGTLTINAAPVVLQPQTFVQSFYKKVLEEVIVSQKKLNIYQNGGFNLIQTVESQNAGLFLNTTKAITSTIANFTSEPKEIFAGATYILGSPLIPILNN